MQEIRIHHLRLLLVLSQLACMFLFPMWMYTDVWQIITQLHRVRQHIQETVHKLSLLLSPSPPLSPSVSFFPSLSLLPSSGTTLRLAAVSSSSGWCSGFWAELCSLQYHLDSVSSQLLSGQCYQANCCHINLSPVATESCDHVQCVWYGNSNLRSGSL